MVMKPTRRGEDLKNEGCSYNDGRAGSDENALDVIDGELLVAPVVEAAGRLLRGRDAQLLRKIQ
jgi:hypothetical protein